MPRFLIILILCSVYANAKSKKTPKLSIDLKYSKFSVQQKKKKIILSCKPLKIKNASNSNWIRECNNIAFNLLSREKYQNILIEKHIEDQPFGNLSYQAAKELGASFMKRKSIRKSFKTQEN